MNKRLDYVVYQLYKECYPNNIDFLNDELKLSFLGLLNPLVETILLKNTKIIKTKVKPALRTLKTNHKIIYEPADFVIDDEAIKELEKAIKGEIEKEFKLIEPSTEELFHFGKINKSETILTPLPRREEAKCV